MALTLHFRRPEHSRSARSLRSEHRAEQRIEADLDAVYRDDDYLDDITCALGIEREQVIAHQWVDNGPGWAVVQLPTADDVLALEPDLSRIPTAMIGAIGSHPDGSEYATVPAGWSDETGEPFVLTWKPAASRRGPSSRGPNGR